MTTDPPVRSGLSIAAVLSFVGGVVLLALHMTVRLFGAFGWGPENENTNFDPGLIFGLLGLLSFIPIVLELVCGHVGFIATRPGSKRGRTLAVAGLTMGYVLLAFYLNRLIVVIIVSVNSGEWGLFVPNFFWWA